MGLSINNGTQKPKWLLPETGKFTVVLQQHKSVHAGGEPPLGQWPKKKEYGYAAPILIFLLWNTHKTSPFLIHFSGIKYMNTGQSLPPLTFHGVKLKFYTPQLPIP